MNQSCPLVRISALLLPGLLLLTAACSTPAPTPPGALDAYQGHWEGEGPPGTVAITIEGDALHYVAGEETWDATIVLPPDTLPQVLHATITGSSETGDDDVGEVVLAIAEVTGGRLRIGTGGGEAPESFDDAEGLYDLRRVAPEGGH